MTAFSGLGPLPGTDVRAAAEILAGECGATPHLPILADHLAPTVYGMDYQGI